MVRIFGLNERLANDLFDSALDAGTLPSPKHVIDRFFGQPLCALECCDSAEFFADSRLNILRMQPSEGHVISPKTITEKSDNPNNRGRQRGATENSVGNRIISALGSRTMVWLARETGLAESTLGDAIKRGIAKTDMAVRLAHALGVSVDWLLTGETPSSSPAVLVSADEADFVRLPRFDLTQLTDQGKGARVETIPVRKDWLYRRILTTANLWLTELPSDNEPLNLQEGDVVICSDVRAEGVQDNWVCLFRAPTGLFVAKYHLMANGEAGTIGPAGLADDDVRPIARIHARMIARV